MGRSIELPDYARHVTESGGHLYWSEPWSSVKGSHGTFWAADITRGKCELVLDLWVDAERVTLRSDGDDSYEGTSRIELDRGFFAVLTALWPEIVEKQMELREARESKQSSE